MILRICFPQNPLQKANRRKWVWEFLLIEIALSVFSIKWLDTSKEETRKKDKGKLEKWLKLKLDLDTLVVKRIN